MPPRAWRRSSRASPPPPSFGRVGFLFPRTWSLLPPSSQAAAGVAPCPQLNRWVAGPQGGTCSGDRFSRSGQRGRERLATNPPAFGAIAGVLWLEITARFYSRPGARPWLRFGAGPARSIPAPLARRRSRPTSGADRVAGPFSLGWGMAVSYPPRLFWAVSGRIWAARRRAWKPQTRCAYLA